MNTTCAATRHNTVRAYPEHHCRCPEIVARMRARWRREHSRPGARRRLNRDQVLTAYVALADQGLLHKQIARRLGLTSGGLTYHLTAGRKAHDPRAFIRSGQEVA